MIEKIKALWIKYEEIIAYLIVGVLTTIVSLGAKFLVNYIFFDNTMYPDPVQNAILSMVNWTSGVIFAYFTNRRFVFKSHEPIRKEAPKFVLSRVSTLILDAVLMQVLTPLGWILSSPPASLPWRSPLPIMCSVKFLCSRGRKPKGGGASPLSARRNVWPPRLQIQGTPFRNCHPLCLRWPG